jgi:hypothetical protein
MASHFRRWKNLMDQDVRTAGHANRTIFCLVFIDILPCSEISFKIKKLNGTCPGILKTAVGFPSADCCIGEGVV